MAASWGDEFPIEVDLASFPSAPVLPDLEDVNVRKRFNNIALRHELTGGVGVGDQYPAPPPRSTILARRTMRVQADASDFSTGSFTNPNDPSLPIPSFFDIQSDFSIPSEWMSNPNSASSGSSVSAPSNSDENTEATTPIVSSLTTSTPAPPTLMPTQPVPTPIPTWSIQSVRLAAGTCIPCPALGLTLEEQLRLKHSGGVALRMAYYINRGNEDDEPTTEAPSTGQPSSTAPTNTGKPINSDATPSKSLETMTITSTYSEAVSPSTSPTGNIEPTDIKDIWTPEILPPFSRTQTQSRTRQSSQTIPLERTRSATPSTTATIGPELVWVDLRYCDECPVTGHNTYTIKPSVSGESAATAVGLVIGILAVIVHLVLIRYACKKPMRKDSGRSKKPPQHVMDMSQNLDSFGIMGSISDRETALQVANNYQRFVLQQMMSEFMAMNGNNSSPSPAGNRSPQA